MPNTNIVTSAILSLSPGSCGNKTVVTLILNSKLCEISCAHNFFLSCQNVLEFCAEHESATAMRQPRLMLWRDEKFQLRHDILYCNGPWVIRLSQLNSISVKRRNNVWQHQVVWVTQPNVTYKMKSHEMCFWYCWQSFADNILSGTSNGDSEFSFFRSEYTVKWCVKWTSLWTYSY